MVHAPGSGRPWCTPWPDRRVISPALAAMLTEARRARGLSLRKAARLAGCTPGTIVHLEKGRRAPSLITAWGIIGAYKLGPFEAERLMAEAVDDVGKNSPYKTGLWLHAIRGAPAFLAFPWCTPRVVVPIGPSPSH